jgi:hypothetical protein
LGYTILIVLQILHPSQNIIKSWSIKVNVFCPNFLSNTSNFFDSFLFTFWNRESSILNKKINNYSIIFVNLSQLSISANVSYILSKMYTEKFN